MKLNLFTKNNCDFCAMLQIPEGLDVAIHNIDEGYEGFVPPNLPVLQVGGLNLEGPEVINIIFRAIDEN